MTTSNTVPHHSPPVPFCPPEDKYVRRPTKSIPRSVIEAARVTEKQNFDACKHVDFVAPTKIYTMDELGLGGMGISPVAISEPFPLFTKEAIQQMRGEIFSERVLEHHQYASSFATNQIRGHCPSDAPFITKAWNDPKVLAAISQVAGIELVPCWSYDIGHTNITINVEEDDAERTHIRQDADQMTEQQEKEMSAFGWHYDSVPFVCVTMLSDCADMVGGETMIRTGHGTYMKVRGPQMGTAVVMQGRYIKHQALKAFGGRERISMVTSLRPKSPLIRDESILTGMRGTSNLAELYYQYATYRCEILEERLKEQRKEMVVKHDLKQEFNVKAMREFLLEQREYIDTTLAELVDVK